MCRVIFNIFIANLFLFKIIYGQSNSSSSNCFSVEFWERDDAKNKVFNRSYFDTRGNIIASVGLDPDKSECNLIDSVVFINNEKGQCIKQMEFLTEDLGSSTCRDFLSLKNVAEYFYNNEGQLINMKGLFERPQVYQKLYFTVNIKDSLSLLSDELNDINTIVINADTVIEQTAMLNSKSVSMKKYTGDFIVSIMSEYNIPSNIRFKSMINYLFENTLLRDEFELEGYHIIRDYAYNNGLIKTITISIRTDNHQEIVIQQGFNINIYN